jgi:outer membrane protein assembly factor BamB
VYVAGEFRTVNGTARDSLARLDASTGALHAAFKHTIYGQPHSAAVGSGRLYLAGTITSVDGRARSRLAAFDLSTGALDAGWAPVADDRVEGVVATADRIYLAGKFHTINGVSGSARLAAVSPSSGAVDLSFRPRASVIAHSMAIGPNRVYAAHGGQGGRVVAYDLAGRTAWTLTMDGDPQAVAVLDGVLYIGGHFDNVCRSTRTGDRGVCLDGSVRRVKLAAATLDGALAAWTANGNGIDGVHALAASPALSRVAAGGSFTTINGVTHPRFAQFRR